VDECERARDGISIMINKTVAEEQSGFRGGRSTVDRTFTLRPVIEE
jgi:hypothetical protein